METWSEKIHVKSSMEQQENQYAMFIGRWQPLHYGHISMFEQGLNRGKKLLICIRETEISEKNPYPSEIVKETIENYFSHLVAENKVKVIIIPDIQSVEFGRGVGYDIIEHIPPTTIGNISATKIREEMQKKKS
jgi:cytidyltransferase-like protein